MSSRIRYRASIVLLAFVGCVGLSVLLLRPARPGATSGWWTEDHPPLFNGSEECPRGARSEERTSRFERNGHMYADRYSFDPADGVRAVHELRVAGKCYAELGLRDDARRVELVASTLARKVDADYASSRNILANALASEQWRVALVETRRLLRFTAHVPGGRYVEWLQQMLGKAASRASHQR